MLRPSISASKYHKVFVFGLKRCGKTCLLDQLVHGTQPNYSMPKDPESTIEDIYSVSIDNEERGCREKVHLFETESPSSLETCDFERLVKSVINYADGIVLVFAINSRESFSVIQLLKRAIDKFKEKKELPMILLGNKIDKFRERQIDSGEVTTWATKERLRYWEVSATERKSLMDPFLHLVTKLNPVQAKSGFPRLGHQKGSKTTSSVSMEL